MLGAISAGIARQPVWALAEWGLVVIHVHLALAVVYARNVMREPLDLLILGTATFVCTALIAKFLVSYVSALHYEDSGLDVWILFSGFSNIRFFGQFQTMTIPLLAVPLLAGGRLRRYAPLAVILGAFWWTLAIASGTRGTWLALGLVIAAFWWINQTTRRWAALQIAGAIIGALLFVVFFSIIPQLLNWEVVNHAGGRIVSTLSAREVIWSQAIEMIISRPLLGYGPMHFADILNPVAAHPHQAWLQVAAEWGLPAALLVTWLVFRGSLATFKVMRCDGRDRSDPTVFRVCVAAAVFAALVQSMVDGVIVMPYSQLWLALLVGWLMALHPLERPQVPLQSWIRLTWVAAVAAAVIFVGYVVARDAPDLEGRKEAFAYSIGGSFKPRFWLQGVIAEPPASRIGDY